MAIASVPDFRVGNVVDAELRDKLDAAGALLLDGIKRPACRLVSATQGVGNAADGLMPWPTESVDTADMFDPGSSSQITITEAGFYLATFTGAFASNSTGFRRASIYDDNSANPYWIARDSKAAVNGDATYMRVTALFTASAPGSVLKAYVYQNSGGNLNITNSVFTVVFLSAKTIG